MQKLECDVIRDLLPSYVDEICSKTSKHYVDEHLQNCPECDRLMRQLRDTDFSTSKLEQRELNGYKKAKRQMSQQGISGALLVAALIFSAIAGLWLIVHGGGVRCIPAHYVLLSICIACTIYFVHIRKPTTPMHRMEWSIAILSIFSLVYLTCLLLYCLTKFKAGRIPFAGVIRIEQYGTWMRYQLNAVAILQMMMYFLLLWRSMKQRINNSWILCLCITGSCVSHLYKTFLGAMDLTIEMLKNDILYVMLMASIALGIGLVGSVLSLILSKFWVKA